MEGETFYSSDRIASLLAPNDTWSADMAMSAQLLCTAIIHHVCSSRPLLMNLALQAGKGPFSVSVTINVPYEQEVAYQCAIACCPVLFDQW